MKLTLGFSPCPNDTFIFDALINNKIDCEGIEFEPLYEDVESLNQKAFKASLDITKLSFHAYAYAVKHYALLDAGSALGFGVGPLLISAKSASEFDPQDRKLRVGIPGKYTTANFLFSLAYPHINNTEEMLFSSIEDALLDGRIDGGLIIHENRFTYQQKGLHKIMDLGQYWEAETGCAIPLGGIVIKRSLPQDIKLKVNRLVRRSVEYAFEHPKSALEFVRSHAQAMDEEVMYKHIDLYVNKYSVDLGPEGRRAIQLLFDTAVRKNVISQVEEHLFLT